MQRKTVDVYGILVGQARGNSASNITLNFIFKKNSIRVAQCRIQWLASKQIYLNQVYTQLCV